MIRGFTDKIREFDVAFFRQRRRQLQDYFPLPCVLKGIFSLIKQHFGLEFTLATPEEDADGGFGPLGSLWHPDFSSDQETAMYVIRYAELIGQQCQYLTLIVQSPQLRDWQRRCCLGYRRHKLSWKTALLSTRHVSHLKTCHSGHLVRCLQQHQDCQRSV